MTEGLERWRKWAAARMRAGLAWYRARHAVPRDVFAGDNSQYIASSRRHGLLIVAYGLVGAQLAWDESQRRAAAALYGHVEKILWSSLRRSRTSARGRGPGTGRRPWLRDRFDGIPTGRRCSWRWPVGSARWSPVSVRRGDDRLAARRIARRDQAEHPDRGGALSRSYDGADCRYGKCHEEALVTAEGKQRRADDEC